jgi:hypothetical protein
MAKSWNSSLLNCGNFILTILKFILAVDEWSMCRIWCWMEETNWVYVYEIVTRYVVTFLNISNVVVTATVNKTYCCSLPPFILFFLTSVRSWWIKSHCNGTRPRCKCRWWYMHQVQKWRDLYLCVAPLFKLNPVCDMWSRVNNIW